MLAQGCLEGREAFPRLIEIMRSHKEILIARLYLPLSLAPASLSAPSAAAVNFRDLPWSEMSHPAASSAQEPNRNRETEPAGTASQQNRMEPEPDRAGTGWSRNRMEPGE